MIELLHTDCMTYMAGLPDKAFDVCITDPPYNVGFKYNTHDDNMSNYKEWCAGWLAELQRITSGLIAISCGIRNIGMWHEIQSPTWVAAWYKPATMGRSPLGFNNWEPIMIYGKARKQSVDVIKAVIVSDKNMDFHPCPKPIAWAKQQLLHFANEGDRIFDPFAGSGTTAIAAYDGGFDFVGCEIDAEYYAAALKRFNIHKQQLVLL